VNGWRGRRTNRKARFKRIRWKRRRIIREKSKIPALKNRGQGTQHPKSSQGLSPGHPSVLDARQFVFRVVAVGGDVVGSGRIGDGCQPVGVIIRVGSSSSSFDRSPKSAARDCRR